MRHWLTSIHKRDYLARSPLFVPVSAVYLSKAKPKSESRSAERSDTRPSSALLSDSTKRKQRVLTQKY